MAKSSQQSLSKLVRMAAVTPCQAYTVMVEAAEFDDALLDYSDEELDASIEQPPLTIEGEMNSGIGRCLVRNARRLIEVSFRSRK